jgi:mono/diheme cytochrome c family protein
MRHLFLFCFLILTTPALAEGQVRRDAGREVERGRQLVTLNCAPCHAVGVTGQSPNPKSPPLRQLSKKYPLQDLEEALAVGIMVGHNPEMPQWRLSPSQIADLLAYLGSIQKP